jgi:hypothetical protein
MLIRIRAITLVVSSVLCQWYTIRVLINGPKLLAKTCLQAQKNRCVAAAAFYMVLFSNYLEDSTIRFISVM